jgi:rSAM/selenodomain-associated transferase 2
MEGETAMSVSIVIPTLNSADTLSAVLASVAEADETIVADGGSQDGTLDLAVGLGARVINTSRGRGAQLVAGAAIAGCEWLLFLHADTILALGWRDEVDAFMSIPSNSECAAVFRFSLDDESRSARRLERAVEWRTRVLKLPYGDQGLLIARSFYNRLGGFREMPLMEDVDLVRRIGRRRIIPLKTDACTSSRRWHREGWWRRSARNLLCLSLYLAGASPRLIQRIYG